MDITNRILYGWNPVYKFVMQIKDEYMAKYNYTHAGYDCQTIKNKKTGGIKTLTCLEKWAVELGKQEYIKRLQPLEINQNGTLILLRYGNYTSNKQGEEEINIFDENFFELYDGFYKECRSVVIDVEAEVIVLCPFKKFRNLNECEETSLTNVREKILKAKRVEISEKIDGSMQTASSYKGQIIMAGAQAVDPANSWRLQDGYQMILSNKNYVKMIKNNPNWTFIFEYVSLKDAHVVKYTKEQEGMYLIGIRDKITGKQYSYQEVIDIAQFYLVEKTIQIYLQSLDEVLSELDKYKSNEREGVVLYIDGFQVKIKYNDYVQIHRILSIVSSSNLIIEHIADNKYDDLISKVPEAYRLRINKIKDVICNYINEMEEKVNNYLKEANDNSNNKKEFMIYVDKNVPLRYKGYVKNKYLGKPYSYLKSQLSSDTPHYYNLSELGLKEQVEKIQGEGNE